MVPFAVPHCILVVCFLLCQTLARYPDYLVSLWIAVKEGGWPCIDDVPLGSLVKPFDVADPSVERWMRSKLVQLESRGDGDARQGQKLMSFSFFSIGGIQNVTETPFVAVVGLFDALGWRFLKPREEHHISLSFFFPDGDSSFVKVEGVFIFSTGWTSGLLLCPSPFRKKKEQKK
jgi:hypothetical protein